MKNFLSEIKGDVFLEKFYLFSRKYKLIIFLLILVSMLFISFYTKLNIYNNVKNKNFSNIYEYTGILLKEKKVSGAIILLDQLHYSNFGYSGISYLYQSFILQQYSLDKKNINYLNSFFISLINNSNEDASFIELSILLESFNHLDKVIPKYLSVKLIDIIYNKSIWSGVALEILGLNALKLNQYDDARAFFLNIVNNNNYQKELRVRSGIFLNFIPKI